MSTCSPRPLLHLNTRAVTVGFTLAGWLVVAAPGFAQQPTQTKEHSKQHPISDMTPCIPEMVQGTGNLHLMEKTSPSDFRFKMHEFGNLNGADTGAEYQYQNHTENSVQTNAQNFEFRFQIKKHIIRKGAPKKDQDDYFQVITMREKITNGVPVVSIDETKTECK